MYIYVAEKSFGDSLFTTCYVMDFFSALKSKQKQSYVYYKNPPIIKYFLVFEFTPTCIYVTSNSFVDNLFITSYPMDSLSAFKSEQKQSYVHYKNPPIIKYFLVFEFTLTCIASV